MQVDINTIPLRTLREAHRRDLILLFESIYEEKQRQVTQGRLTKSSFAGWEKTVLTRRTLNQIADNSLRGSDLASCTIFWVFDQVMHCPVTRRSDLWQRINDTWGGPALLGQRTYNQVFPEYLTTSTITVLEDLFQSIQKKN